MLLLNARKLFCRASRPIPYRNNDAIGQLQKNRRKQEGGGGTHFCPLAPKPKKRGRGGWEGIGSSFFPSSFRLGCWVVGCHLALTREGMVASAGVNWTQKRAFFTFRSGHLSIVTARCVSKERGEREKNNAIRRNGHFFGNTCLPVPVILRQTKAKSCTATERVMYS